MESGSSKDSARQIPQGGPNPDSSFLEFRLASSKFEAVCRWNRVRSKTRRCRSLKENQIRFQLARFPRGKVKIRRSLQVESGSSKDSARQMQLSSLKEDAQRYRAERDKLATRTAGPTLSFCKSHLNSRIATVLEELLWFPTKLKPWLKSWLELNREPW